MSPQRKSLALSMVILSGCMMLNLMLKTPDEALKYNLIGVGTAIMMAILFVGFKLIEFLEDWGKS